ncbi:hypothetical protein [Kitasatospora purpeofusca]|uniref:hypothetical protein n=1 Tax=Kitasatospora purpeofusca TaxID=67352 RepID=UPI00369B227C
MPHTVIPAASMRPVAYAVTCLPDGHPWQADLTLSVEQRDGGWIVLHGFRTLSRDGTWDLTEDGAAWSAQHRFELDQALELARAAAPHVLVNGRGVAQALLIHPGP